VKRGASVAAFRHVVVFETWWRRAVAAEAAQRVEMGGEGGSRKEGGGVVAAGQVLQKRMGLRIVLGALCVGAVVGLSLAIALPATQAAEQVPISPKFEANFWPDERLEQANRRKRNPQSFGSNFKSPFNLQVLPISTIEGLFS